MTDKVKIALLIGAFAFAILIIVEGFKEDLWFIWVGGFCIIAGIVGVVIAEIRSYKGR